LIGEKRVFFRPDDSNWEIAIIFTSMTKKLSFFWCLLLLTYSCNEISTVPSSEIKKEYRKSLINLISLHSEDENEVCFPTWFNDSIIKAHGITKITRKLFARNHDNQDQSLNVSSTVPREIREYFFDESGNITQLNVHYYYDEREIGSVLFSYSEKKDHHGYSKVQRNVFISKTANPFSKNDESIDPEVRELDFKMHEKKVDYKKCLVYQDIETGDYLFYMPQKKYWGALSVDSILRPNPKDIIICGTPNHPYKKYQVSNKIYEKNVRLYSYFEKDKNLLKYWLKKEYPFEFKRDFVYSLKGICNQYIDSTFSENTFVTRIVSELQYNADEEPIRVIRRKENSSHETVFFSLSTFNYEKKELANHHKIKH
jgi:hypothetical protein